MYEFAVNKLKLARAIAETTAENNGKTPAEEVVKDRYVKLRGLLTEDHAEATDKPRAIMAPKSPRPASVPKTPKAPKADKE